MRCNCVGKKSLTDLGPDICQRLSWPKKLCLLPCSLSISRQTSASPCWEPPMTATQKTKQKFIEVLSKWDTLGKGFQIQLRAYIWTHPCMSSWESCLTSYINLFRHFPGMQRGPDIQWRSLDKFHKANYIHGHRTRFWKESYEKKIVFL